MQALRNTGEVLLIAAFSFLLFILFFESRLQLPPWVQVLGRMHPLFLHFPIVLLLLYLAVFWMPSKGEWAKGLGLLAALTATLTAIMGLLLALEEERDGNLFFLHKWGGVGIAVMACAVYAAHALLMRKKWLARPFSFLTALLLLATGHFGAGLTHGDDYLLAPLASGDRALVPLDEALSFQHVVQPVFKQKCVSCHSTANSKGGLVLDDTASVMHGGKAGPLYVAGSPEQSLLLKRILLPLDDKKHMAPKGKPQLTEEEIALLTAWVKAGAPLNQKVISLPVEDSFRVLAASRLSPSSGGHSAFAFGAADEKTIQSLNTNFRVIRPLSVGSPALSVQFFGRSEYKPKALGDLLPLKEQVVELGLARLPVKDEDLEPLLQLVNLRKLNLTNTDVTDKGLLQLRVLKNLEELALAGTAVTPQAIAELAKLPLLKTLYVWNTPIDSAAIVQLQQQHKGLHIEKGYRDDGQTIFTLTPPMAKTASGIYAPATPLELKHPYRGVEIRYTLDESEPDSTNSAVYTKPLSLNKFTVIKSRAFKEGWLGSKSLKAIYFTEGVKPDSVVFDSQAPELKGKENLLFDKDIGDLNLGSGAWMEIKKPTALQLFFKEPVNLQQVALNTFVRMEWDIFPATKMEVWGGMEKSTLKKLATWQQSPPSKMEDPDLRQPLTVFPPVQVKELKLVLYPLASMPAWRPSKGKPSRIFLSEVVVN